MTYFFLNSHGPDSGYEGLSISSTDNDLLAEAMENHEDAMALMMDSDDEPCFQDGDDTDDDSMPPNAQSTPLKKRDEAEQVTWTQVERDLDIESVLSSISVPSQHSSIPDTNMHTLPIGENNPLNNPTETNEEVLNQSNGTDDISNIFDYSAEEILLKAIEQDKNPINVATWWKLQDVESLKTMAFHQMNEQDCYEWLLRRNHKKSVTELHDMKCKAFQAKFKLEKP